jgi:LemA protein
MNTDQWLLAAGGALLIFWMLGAYNRLVGLRNAIIAAWAQVDEPLQRRSQALLALAEGLREPLADEAGALEALRAAQAQLQTAADALRRRPAMAARAQTLSAAEATLAAALARVLALQEQRPSLAAIEPLAVLQESAQRIGFARQLFNDAVHAYNEAVRQFPTRLLSRLFGFGNAGPL